MRNIGFVIFFSLILVIYSLINYYILRRGLQAFSPDPAARKWIITIVIGVAASFVAGRFLERASVNWFSAALIWLGSFWLAIMVYLLMQLLVIDLFRAVNHFVHFLPNFITENPVKAGKITGYFVVIISLIVVTVGHINTWYPATRKMNLNIDKDGGNLKNLHIVALSDIHLGTTIEKRHMAGIVKRVNTLNPDIILIPGDIIDDNSNVGEKLKAFQSKYGVYAVTGNHEYIGGVQKAKKYLAEQGINLLNDTAKLFDESFYVVGREDLTINQFTNSKRKELSEIIDGIDQSKPMILMDHQPAKLEQAENNGIDLQLSGHTHNGQLWPFNFITRMVYELSWGYKQKGNTHYYVSSGVGGWGPPIRTVNRPEIISIMLNFSHEK